MRNAIDAYALIMTVSKYYSSNIPHTHITQRSRGKFATAYKKCNSGIKGCAEHLYKKIDNCIYTEADYVMYIGHKMLDGSKFDIFWVYNDVEIVEFVKSMKQDSLNRAKYDFDNLLKKIKKDGEPVPMKYVVEYVRPEGGTYLTSLFKQGLCSTVLLMYLNAHGFLKYLYDKENDELLLIIEKMYKIFTFYKGNING
jgi:hypothetical protein